MADKDNRAECEANLYRLLQCTLRSEALTAERDTEVSKVQKRFAARLDSTFTEIEELEAKIQAYYVAHKAEIEAGGQKSLQLTHGLIGMRAPANPALVPLTPAWSWDGITSKVITIWKKRFLLAPKPAIDKLKLKRTLSEGELKACGMRLDRSEKFYYELNRLPVESETAA